MERRNSSLSVLSISRIPEYHNYRAPAARMTNHVPQMGTFKAFSTSTTPVEGCEDSDDGDGVGDGEWRPETYATPMARRRVPNFSNSPTEDMLDPRYFMG